MSTFERDNFQWRETYFVLFDTGKRPTLARVEKALRALSQRFQMTAGVADEQGTFRIAHLAVARRLCRARHQLRFG